MSVITSLQNPRVKDAVRLRNRRHREKQGRILIDGARELRRAIAAGVKLLEVFVCEPLCRGDDARHLLASWGGSSTIGGWGGSSTATPTMAGLPQGGEVWHVGETVFERLAFGQRAEGVLAVAEMPRPTLATLNWGGSSTATPTENLTAPLVAVLEGVEKPGNVGAVLRSADAAGVSAVIVADGRTDLFNPNAIRASLGTIFTMPVCEAASGDVLAQAAREAVPNHRRAGGWFRRLHEGRLPSADGGRLGRRSRGAFPDLERR